MQSQRPRLRTAAKTGNTTPSSLTPATKELKVQPNQSLTDTTPVVESNLVDDPSWNSRVSALVEKELKLAERMMMELERREQWMEKRNQELERNERELERRKQELESKEQKVEWRELKLGWSEQELERKVQEVDRTGQDLGSKKQELESKKQKLELREQEIVRKEQELKRAQMEWREEKLGWKEQKLEWNWQVLGNKKQELKSKEQELEWRVHEQELNREVVKEEPAVQRKTKNKDLSNNVDRNSNLIPYMKENGMHLEFDQEDSAIVVFESKVRLILNKLTGRILPGVMEEFQSLKIVSREQLSLCVKLIFEKAVQPGHVFFCAKICEEMQWKKGDDGVNFRRLIIQICQKEFDKICCKDLKDESCENSNLGIRSCAIMQLIGELYMQNMLNTRIMHDCVKRLLIVADEESLECLCKLLFIIAKKFVPETLSKKGPQIGVTDISVYLKQMNKLAWLSSSVRILIKDVTFMIENLSVKHLAAHKDHRKLHSMGDNGSNNVC